MTSLFISWWQSIQKSSALTNNNKATHSMSFLRSNNNLNMCLCLFQVLSCKSSLNVHSKVHSGEKPYNCTEWVSYGNANSLLHYIISVINLLAFIKNARICNNFFFFKFYRLLNWLLNWRVIYTENTHQMSWKKGPVPPVERYHYNTSFSLQ